ncbi:MAG: type 1 glutamine amidotransferase domain-containing protein [Propionicimonas sp.]|nr:type 1 glutamine amidotransferase domain-containing protein [Propionicimonas sp.]
MAKILFLMTGSDHWTLRDGTTHPTGFWAEEAVAPLEAFRAAGHQVVVATPGGVAPPADPASLAVGDADTAAHLAEVIRTSPELAAPVAVEEVDLAGYRAVFVPGGHGPMEDLAVDPEAGRLLADALAGGLVLGVVCHGPAALLAATGADARNAFEGFTVTGFSNAEERIGGLADKAPWLLQDRLEAAGLTVQVGPPFLPHVVTDRNLLTGQNPASSEPLAVAVIDRLG